MTSTPLSQPHSRGKIPDINAFLSIISSDEPVGPSLRYDALFDEVRLARQEDDPRLSMGIWETDIKRADWNKVEDLCIGALVARSKDLQICAWLTEAWVSLDGAEGYIRGIQLLSSLVEAFWDIMHPQIPEDGDLENRSLLFEWMDKAFTARVILLPLTQSKFDDTAFGLGYYKSAQHGDAALKRVDQTRNQQSRSDPSKIIGTVEEFQKSLEQTPEVFLTKQQANLEGAIQVTLKLNEILATLLGSAAPTFSLVLGALKEMVRIITTALQTRIPAVPVPVSEPIPEPTLESTPEPVLEPIIEITSDQVSEKVQPENTSPESIEISAEVIPSIAEEPSSNPEIVAPPTQPQEKTSIQGLNLTSREDAYQQLRAIATFLEESEPHSLVSQLIRQLIKWENRNIVDILAEIAKTPEEYAILMKILGGNPQE